MPVEFPRLRRGVALAVLAVSSLIGLVSSASAQRMDEVIITITRVRAHDKADIFGKNDFYAKITLAGDAIVTPVARQSNDVRPNWMLSKVVKRGKHDIKLQIFDKDPGKPDDVIDINRLPNKRDLDFTIDTGSCVISGFAQEYRCGTTISRAGDERKKAEIQFNVTVKRR